MALSALHLYLRGVHKTAPNPPRVCHEESQANAFPAASEHNRRRGTSRTRMKSPNRTTPCPGALLETLSGCAFDVFRSFQRLNVARELGTALPLAVCHNGCATACRPATAIPPAAAGTSLARPCCGTPTSHLVRKGHFISGPSSRGKFPFVPLSLIKMEMRSTPPFPSKDKAPTGFPHNNPANPRCCAHHNLQREPCAPSAVFTLKKEDGCTLPTLSLCNSSEGETNIYSGRFFAIFFSLLAMRDVFLHAVSSDRFPTRRKAK